MEKVVVLGNKGMLGHVLFHVLKTDSTLNVFGTNRDHNEQPSNVFYLDVLNLKDLKELLENIRPNYVINCIGLLVQSSIENPGKAIETNSLLPHRLKILGDKLNFKLIHISTDCVFDGNKGPYNEEDFKSETNYYGLTKNLGEIICNNHLTIRTSIIGPELKSGSGLFEWILKQSKENNGSVQGYKNVFWSGLTTIELSKFILGIIKNKKNISGLIHATNGFSISKHELIQKVNRIFNLGLNISENIKLEKNKSLINNKIENDFLSYDDQLIELKTFIKQHEYHKRKIS